ncbi:MAG: efflux RND transporter periplasmic adaptor subunit [Verrucomicrobiaceae bacterium]|nr:efflux RND transporter periplasmic adaptor subunit [Verrucomicrobiaceae bacterium]
MVSVLSGLAVLLVSCGKKDPESAKKSGTAMPPFVVEAITVVPQRIEETLTATGTLVANESVVLQSERPAVVTEIHFEEGEMVQAGELMVRMDDSELQPQLERAVAQRRIALTLEKRQSELLKSRGISEYEYEQTVANVKIAEAEEALIRAQIAKTRIVAPFDGVAGLRKVSVGSYLTPGTTICTFQDLSSLKLDFSLPERYLAYLKPGQMVQFRVTGMSESFAAEITAIEPTIDVHTRTMLVRAKVPNEEARLLPGSFTQVEVTLEEIPDALMIPAIALIPGLKQQTVFVHHDGIVDERHVVAGLRTPNGVQIVEGLSAGDEVLVTGVLQVRKGMKVEVRRAATASSSDADGAHAPENGDEKAAEGDEGQGAEGPAKTSPAP